MPNFDLRLDSIQVVWEADELQNVEYFGDFPKLCATSSDSRFQHAVDVEATAAAHLSGLNATLAEGRLAPQWLEQMREKFGSLDDAALLETVARDYAEQDRKHFESWQRDEWQFESCLVSATVSYTGPFGRVEDTARFSASLGGIDAGTGKSGDAYRVEVERELLEELKDQLEEAGVPLIQWDAIAESRARR